MSPGVAAAVTVTVKFCGGGGPLPLLPPQAAGTIAATAIKAHSNHKPRRSFGDFLAIAKLIAESDKHKGQMAAESGPLLSNGTRLAVRFAAFTVRAAVFPGVTDAGEIPHVGAGLGPVTAHDSAMLPANPPCVGKESTSLADPPRCNTRLFAAGEIEKSGGAVTVRSKVVKLFELLESISVAETV